MTMSRPKLQAILLATACALPSMADTIETQHLFETTAPLGKRVDLLVHSRFRTRPDSLGFYQGRFGPIFTIKAWDQVSLIGGYYWQQQQARADGEFTAGHRVFGGAEWDAWSGRKAELDTRGLIERFSLKETLDFNRYRWRLRLGGKGRVAPYVSNEIFWDRQGWRSNRISGGVRWSVGRGWQADFGYFYEHRRFQFLGNRQMWITGLHWRPGAKKKADADP
jgi:hypothetical protein